MKQQPWFSTAFYPSFLLKLTNHPTLTSQAHQHDTYPLGRRRWTKRCGFSPLSSPWMLQEQSQALGSPPAAARRLTPQVRGGTSRFPPRALRRSRTPSPSRFAKRGAMVYFRSLNHVAVPRLRRDRETPSVHAVWCLISKTSALLCRQARWEPHGPSPWPTETGPRGSAAPARSLLSCWENKKSKNKRWQSAPKWNKPRGYLQEMARGATSQHLHLSGTA